MKKTGKKSGTGRRPAGMREWVGGRLRAPFHVEEGGPFRPDMILWMELPEEWILHGRIIDPGEPPVSFSRGLEETMRAPMVGPPRRPDRIRVADPALAGELRGAVPDIEIVVAPTPELNRVLRHMAETFPRRPDAESSYFERGRISPAAVAEMFAAAQALFLAAPWKKAQDTQVLRLDIPGLGVEGACISVIGALGESFGFLVFPSYMAFASLLRAVESRTDSAGEDLDLGTTVLSLNFERAADLPASMRREASRHGWPVARPDAYPWVQHRDRDGILRPLTEHDLRVVTAAAWALTSFFIRHGGLFEQESFEPVCESFCDRNDLEVRITAPYDAGPMFAANDPRPRPPAAPKGAKVGRNEPCPCGSGRKYKKCCLGKEEQARSAASGAKESFEMDARLAEEMIRHAVQRFGEIPGGRQPFRDPEAAMQLYFPWLAYHCLFEGKTAAQWFIEDKGRFLSSSEREWVDAQRAAWISVWEVTGVVPGRSVTLRDLLTDEERTVQEATASRSLVVRDTILGRVMDHGGASFLAGLHPRCLPPREGAAAVERIRGTIRRKSAVPAERLRDEKIERSMIAAWEKALDALALRASIPPSLHNTDGDPLLPTTDHFDFTPAARDEVESRLAAMEGADPPEPGAALRIYAFVRHGRSGHGGLRDTLIGRAEVLAGKLRVETNSIRRADTMRARIEKACGGLLRHRLREHADPRALMKNLPSGPGPRKPAAGLPAEEAGKLLREFKARHYADWADQPLPALGGKTPREAVRTKSGRSAVDLLLKDMENGEARNPEEERYSFSGLRRELGLGA